MYNSLQKGSERISQLIYTSQEKTRRSGEKSRKGDGQMRFSARAHYGCACGVIEKVTGSQLEYLHITVAKFVIDASKAIF